MENIYNIPAKPKDASTLIIIKKEKKETFVLMGQRPLSSRFMPGVYVFPGGVSEKEDYLAYKFFDLSANPHIFHNNIKARSKIHGQSLLLTAIRETAEETGLYLAKKMKYEKKPDSFNQSTWINFIKKSYLPNNHKLYFFGRAITPSTLKIRFHARFFIAFHEDFLGKVKSNGELNNLGWLRLKDVKSKKIADVTEFMINEVIKLNDNFSNISSKKSFPMFTWRRKKRWIKWEN